MSALQQPSSELNNFELGTTLLSTDFRLFLHSREVCFAKLIRIPGQARCLKICCILTHVLARISRADDEKQNGEVSVRIAG